MILSLGDQQCQGFARVLWVSKNKEHSKNTRTPRALDHGQFLVDFELSVVKVQASGDGRETEIFPDEMVLLKFAAKRHKGWFSPQMPHLVSVFLATPNRPHV